jgi:HPt (histidine-containing phosphotransfer) domain-containing protein
MREMFLEKGFNDFLAKPIDISKLDEMLGRWITKDKREWGKGFEDLDSPPDPKDQMPSIPGIDAQKGLAMTGGTVDGYVQVLSLFADDAGSRLAIIRTASEKEELGAFATHVHAIKSASASIGAAGVSALAAELESAARNGDLILINEKLDNFVESLTELVKNIGSYTGVNSGSKTGPTSSSSSLRLLGNLETALKSHDIKAIETTLDGLKGEMLDKDQKAVLEQLSEKVLIAEYDEAAELLKGFWPPVDNK